MAIEMSLEEFERLAVEALDALPADFAERLANVEVVVQLWPSHEQNQKLRVHRGQVLYGLYEGIPQTQRGLGYNLVMPDRITLFQGPLQQGCSTAEELRSEVRHTLMHEL